jgi:hypothetical protein
LLDLDIRFSASVATAIRCHRRGPAKADWRWRGREKIVSAIDACYVEEVERNYSHHLALSRDF